MQLSFMEGYRRGHGHTRKWVGWAGLCHLECDGRVDIYSIQAALHMYDVGRSIFRRLIYSFHSRHHIHRSLLKPSTETVLTLHSKISQLNQLLSWLLLRIQTHSSASPTASRKTGATVYGGCLNETITGETLKMTRPQDSCSAAYNT